MEIAINKPLLPPKAGYVEVEIDGIRKYRNIITGEIFGEETTLTVDERVETLEDQLAQTDETAIALYEAQYAQEEINAAQDESLIYLYERLETIGGN